MDRHERSDKETWVRQVRQRIKSGFGKAEFGQKVRTDKRDQTEGELGQTKIGLVETEVRQKLLGERERERELGQTQLGLVDSEVRQKVRLERERENWVTHSWVWWMVRSDKRRVGSDKDRSGGD